MTSESTRFLGQPSETRPIFICSKSIMAVMRKRCVLTLTLVALAAATGVANVPPAPARVGNVLDRFLAPDEQPLVSYHASRHLSATTRGGKMSASLDAVTSLDPQRGFSYEITKSEGSSLIQSRVLVKALEAEKDAVESTNKAQSALTAANYEFLDVSPMSNRMVRIDVRPRRKKMMLINGHLVVESDSADLVRLEGDLSQRPSFWTRHVHVVREYAGTGGLHWPAGRER